MTIANIICGYRFVHKLNSGNHISFFYEKIAQTFYQIAIICICKMQIQLQLMMRFLHIDGPDKLRLSAKTGPGCTGLRAIRLGETQGVHR